MCAPQSRIHGASVALRLGHELGCRGTSGRARDARLPAGSTTRHAIAGTARGPHGRGARVRTSGKHARPVLGTLEEPRETTWRRGVTFTGVFRRLLGGRACQVSDLLYL